MDQVNVGAWTGRMTRDTGGISAELARQLCATLGDDGFLPLDGSDLMPLAHWCAFPTAEPIDGLGPDGHPKTTDILPPFRLPRRMWSGGSVRFRGRLRVGEPLERLSTVRAIKEKEGSSGRMVFVTLDHAIYGSRGLAIEERQDIVFLEAQKAFTPPQKRPMKGQKVGTLEVPETLLFRYSAVTFNAHRIHYDKPYATEVENYPGLVVHGPLQASFLMQAAILHKGRVPSFFDYKGVHPMFAGTEMSICIEEEDTALNLWTGQGGHQGMQATAIWEETQ